MQPGGKRAAQGPSQRLTDPFSSYLRARDKSLTFSLRNPDKKKFSSSYPTFSTIMYRHLAWRFAARPDREDTTSTADQFSSAPT